MFRLYAIWSLQTKHYLLYYIVSMPKLVIAGPQIDFLYPTPPQHTNVQKLNFENTFLDIVLKTICVKK